MGKHEIVVSREERPMAGCGRGAGAMKKTVITIVCVIVGALVATAAIVFGLVPLIDRNECASRETACKHMHHPASPSPSPSSIPVPPSPSPSSIPALVYKPALYVYTEP